MVERVTQFAGGAIAGATLASRPELLDPRAIWFALWRQRWVVIAITTLFTAAAVAFVLLTTALYQSETLVKIEPGQSLAINLPEITGRFEADAPTIESEIEYLTSNAFLGRITDEQLLIDDPEFNLELDNNSDQPTIRTLFSDELAVRSTQNRSLERRATLKILKEAVAVNQVGRSYVLSIAVQSIDPDKAAKLANAIAETYLITQLEKKYQASAKAATWLSDKVRGLREQVVSLEDRLVRLQIDQGIFSDSAVDPLAQQIIQLNAKLAEAQALRAETEARFNAVQRLLQSRGGLSAAGNVLTSPLMAELRTEEILLQRRLSDLAATFGERHPQIVNAKAELSTIRSKIRAEVQRILSDLENEVQIALAREFELKSSLSQLQSNVASQERSSVSARELQREAESARDTYERYLLRLSEVTEAQNLHEPDAIILSEAAIALEPAYPKKKLIVILVFAGSLMAAIGVAFLIERWHTDFGFKSGEEIQEVTGLNVLSMIPELDPSTLGDSRPEDFIVDRPLSLFGEALQRLRTNLYLKDGDPCRSLLITSSVPIEGKTLTAVSLARQSAKSGIRTLLIDADMRKPRAHAALNQINGQGLSDILRGRANLDQVLTIDRDTGLHFLRSGHEVESPADLCRSRTMKMLLKDCAADYDLVIVDSPPVAAVTDSAVLSEFVDHTLYVVRWNWTPRNVIQNGLKQMHEAGGNIAGIVLSMVDLKKQAQYGYGDVGAYQGYYGEHHSS